MHPVHNHLQNLPASQVARSQGAQALPSLQLGRADACPHLVAWTRLHRAHTAPPAEQGYWVKGFLQSEAWDPGLRNVASSNVAHLPSEGCLRRDWEHRTKQDRSKAIPVRARIYPTDCRGPRIWSGTGQKRDIFFTCKGCPRLTFAPLMPIGPTGPGGPCMRNHISQCPESA